MRASRTERLQSTAALYTVTELRGKVSAFYANKFPCARVRYLSPAAYRQCTCASHHLGAIVKLHTLAVSARLMLVSASPSPLSGRPSRPHLQSAGGLRAGDSCGNRQRRRAIDNVKHPAPTGLSGHALRQQFASSLRAPAGSDDARNAPADKDLRWLAQVMAPSDGLTARQNRRPCNAICPGPPIAGHVSRSAIWRTPSPGTRAQTDEPTCSSNRHRCQCRVPRRRERRPRHKTGVVSRVPCSFRNAQAFGADRNTYLTTSHQRRQTNTRGNEAREGGREPTATKRRMRYAYSVGLPGARAAGGCGCDAI